MAQVEPMDIDAIESDFDNKENAFHYNNVLSRTPCTEKGYEELDVSELNMKLRYSVTPASSPMSKSFTGPSLDNRNCSSEDYPKTAVGAENGNLTRSLNSTLTKTEGLHKSKVLPLQTLSTDPFVDGNRNSAIHRLLDPNDDNVIISVNNASDIDENVSLPSTCSSLPDTPEATTPTKEVPKPEGSPIMRGLKSVLSMFRPSQSPILPADDKSTKLQIVSTVECSKSDETAQVSTPVAANKQSDVNSSKRSSPLKESLVFNDDLERELQWKDETTIIFKDERIPIHKLFLQNPITEMSRDPKTLNTTVEHMDILCDETNTIAKFNKDVDKNCQSVLKQNPVAGESDNEFLDCESTFTRNESFASDSNNLEINNSNLLPATNVTVDLSNNSNAEIPMEINLDCKDILKNSVHEILGDITCTEESSVPVTNEHIIETTNLLTSQSNDYHKIAISHNDVLQNKSEVSKELENTTHTDTAGEQVEKDDDLINAAEVNPCPSFDTIYDTKTFKSLEEEMRASENRICCNIDKLPDVCVETLSNIDNSNDRVIDTLSTNETNEIPDNEAITVNDMNIGGNYLASNNRTINLDITNVIGFAPSIDRLNMVNESESTQVHEFESNTDLLNCNKCKTVIDSESPVIIESCFEAAKNSNNFEGILDIHQKITENMPITDSVGEYNVLKKTDGNISIDNNNSNCSAISINNTEHILDDVRNTIEDMPKTQSTKGEDDISLKMSFSSSVKDVITPTNSSIAQFNFNDELNASNIDLDENSTQITIVNKSNDSNMKDNLENDKKIFSLQTISKDNVESTLDNNMKSYVIANTNSEVNIVSDNNREIPKLLTESDTAVSKQPSEIPLPNEDDTEQYIFESNGTYNKDCKKQNLTAYETCKKDPNDVETELVLDCMKYDQARLVINPIEEMSEMKPINEHNIEVLDKEVISTESVTRIDHMHMTNSETIDMKSESMGQDKILLVLPGAEKDIQTDETLPKDISILDGIYKNVELEASKIKENGENLIADEKIHTDTEEICSITEKHLEYSEKDGNLNSLIKSKETQQIKIDAVNPEDYPSEKRLDANDEEIITSANNSPYVSVTDLDIIVEKNLKEPLEEIAVPCLTETNLVSSPPISPKIVSKGYNFNFDEIDDPFATKTKIRVSPTPDSPNQSPTTITQERKTPLEVPKVIRRKAQPDKKRSIQKKHLASALGNKISSSSEKCNNSAKNTATKNVLDISSPHTIMENILECKPENCVITVPQYNEVDDKNKLVTSSDTSVLNEETQSNNEGIKSIEQAFVKSTEKSTSSSEQYFSLGTSSGESSGLMNRSKNVFNLPEIDDVNFNPFAAKSKIRMSPPPAEKLTSPDDITNSLLISQQSDTTTTNKDNLMFHKETTNDSSPNTSNASGASKNTNDIDCTVRVILTEDEDTVEGPFLEVDDLKDTQKLTDMDMKTDITNFEIPRQQNEENVENGELFIDADAFEFLLNQNKSTTVLDSGKESLFLKFDPLFAKRVSSEGILAALSKVQKRQSTPKKATKPTQKDFNPVEKITVGPANDIENCGPIEEYNEDLSSIMTKPMMVVNPAVSSITQKKSAAPKLNRRSLTFTSPAMAVIDRLLSLSGNASHMEHDTSIPQIGREHSETDLAITQLRELLAEKEINVHSLRSESKDLKDRLAALEVQVRGLETESTGRLAKINELNERLLEKTKMNKSMAIVVEEYERTIASLIAETEQDRKRNAEERNRLIKERDEQTAHLTSMEVSFSDLHSKYEKSKQIILSCKANEDIYKKSIKEFQDNFSKMQNNYELLKQHATSKLNHANQELEKMNRAHEAEVLKMNAMIKRKELHITSLEETLTQKTKANEELTAICDELINKVG